VAEVYGELGKKEVNHVKHTEIALDAAVLDSYTGQYEAKGEGIFVIVREAGALTIQSPADWGCRNCAFARRANAISLSPSSRFE
jgi:hypothetical protein